MRSRLLAFALWVLGCSHALAGVTPMKLAQLVHALEEAKPCCVIDGRSEASRASHPLDEAVPYRDGIALSPNGMMVVVAESDEAARQIADRLDAAYPGQNIIVVLGGIATWEAAQVELSRLAASKPKQGFGFIIPRNTCESGSSIQNLKSKLNP